MCCDCDLSPLAATLGSRLDRHRRRLHREYLKFGTAEAGALHHEHRRSVEQAVQRAQQRVVAGEELVPVVRGRVAGQYHRVGAVLLVASVDDIEEEARAHLVERASPHLVDYEAGRLHQRGDSARSAAGIGGPPQLVPQLGGLKVVRLAAAQAALPAVGLGQVRLPDAAGPYERQVLARVQVRERRQLAQRRRVPPAYAVEVEAGEGLGGLLGKPAEPEQRLDE